MLLSPYDKCAYFRSGWPLHFFFTTNNKQIREIYYRKLARNDDKRLKYVCCIERNGEYEQIRANFVLVPSVFMAHDIFLSDRITCD